MTDTRSTKRWIILFTAIAVPGALGIETLIRLLVLPVEFEEVRIMLGPAMTSFAWGMAGLTAISVVLGILLQRFLVRRAAARARPEGTAEGGADKGAGAGAGMGAFLLAASVPQAPAILGAFSFLVGAEPLPVLIAVVLSTAGVCVQAAKVQ